MSGIVTSEVRIANRALVLLGSVERITSFTDGSPLANQMKDLWHESRRALLVRHPWNCALRRALLNRAGGAPLFGYANRFAVPADYLRWLPPGQDDDAWFEGVEEDGFILTDAAAPLPFRYIFDQADVTKWPPHLQEAMACKIAMDLAESATQIAGNVEDARVKFEGQLVEAKKLDGLATGARSRGNVLRGSRWLGGYVGTRG